MSKRLLLISNSTMSGEPYLQWPRPYLSEFLGTTIKKALFIPYAGIAMDKTNLEKSYDIYSKRVSTVFESLGCAIIPIHTQSHKAKAIHEADCILVGGGNTFHLVQQLHQENLMLEIKSKVKAGTPFIGWSAGANIACPTLCTTNDMPIVLPQSFNCLGLLPFQINPHYMDAHPEGHGGETREQRIDEFITVNKNIYVAGLREGCLLKFENDKLHLVGNRSMRVFKYGTSPKEYSAQDDISFLMPIA